MESVWVNGTDDQLPADDSTIDLPVFGVRSILTPIPIIWPLTLMPDDLTLDYMRVSLENAPGVGETRTIALYRSGAAPIGGPSVLIAGADTEGQDLTNGVIYTPGQDAFLRCFATAGAAASRLRFTFRCTTGVTGQSVLACTGDTGALHNVNTVYSSFSGAQVFGGIPATAGDSVMLVFPCDGTVDKLYVEISVAPGSTGFGSDASRVFTVFDQGGATAVTCTIAGAATTANDTTHSFAVSAGDIMYLECVPVASVGRGAAPPLTARMSASVAFVADDGKSFILPSKANQLDPVNNAVFQQFAGVGAWNATEAEVLCLAQKMKLTRLQVIFDGSVGLVGSGYSIMLRHNQGDSALWCDVATPATACSDDDTIIIADDDFLDIDSEDFGGAAIKAHMAASLKAEMISAIQGAAAMSLF